MTLSGGALHLRLVTVHERSGKVVVTLNGRPCTGSGRIDSLIGKGRAIAGIENTLATLRKLRGS